VLGPTGANGARGATGANGVAGATGPIGFVGATGAKGDQGTQGIQGSNGTILWLNPDGDSKTNELIVDSYLLSPFPIQSSMKTIGPISVSATYGNTNKMIPASRFWNNAPTLSSLAVIPSGVWSVNLYAAVPSNSDANQVSIYAAVFMITGTESQPSPDSLIIETKEGGDAGYYPPRAAYLPDHVKYIGRSWETSSTPANASNTLTNNTTGVIVTSTAKNLYKIQMPVDFVILKDAAGNAENVYLQLQIYVKNTKTANQNANVLLYYQTNPTTSETTYSYLQTTFGAVGSRGVNGVAGSVGPTGSTGNNGLAGPIGSTGSAGPTGPIGARGPTGPQGATGPTGPAGQSNSFGVQNAVQYRSNAAPLGANDPNGSFGGSANFQFVPGPVGFTTNASDASMGTVVINDLACNSIHSSFYIENPSITGTDTRPRTFVRGGGYKLGDNSNYIVLASGKDVSGGATNSPATPADITHGIKLTHNIDGSPATATINIHDNSKIGQVAMKFDLTNGNITAADDKFCLLNSSGRVGVGGITPSEMVGASELNRALHVSGNVMVGTQPGANPTTQASSAMIMLNEPTSAPWSKTYPGIYHRSVLGTAATTLGLTDSSGGLGITAPNFITFQTGTGTPQSNSIVIDSSGNASMMGRTNMNGRVGIGRNFQDNSTHGGVQSIFDVSGTTHISNVATTYGADTPRIKLISNSINIGTDTPSSTQSVNEIRGVNSSADSGFLRLTAQSPANSCIDLVGANTNSASAKNNSVRISTGGTERVIINSLGVQLLNGTLNMGANQINNLRDPSGNQDAATRNYVETQLLNGGTANNPTINNYNNITSTLGIVLSPGTGRQALGSDGDFAYVPNTNTLTVGNAVMSSTTGTPLDVAGNAILRTMVRIGSATAPTVALDVTGTGRMTATSATATALTTTGRVGVNTATPTVDLDVSGAANVSNYLSVGSGSFGSGATTSNIPNAFYVRVGTSNWRDYIPLLVADPSTNILTWGPTPDQQWFTLSNTNYIKEQFSYFAAYWLNVNRAVVGTQFQVEAFASTPPTSRGMFTFRATAVETNGSVTSYEGKISPLYDSFRALVAQQDGTNAGVARRSLSNRTLLMGGNVETGYLAVVGNLNLLGAARMAAASATATALTITGRVGVNTATPTADLDVSGASRMTAASATATALTTTGRIGVNMPSPTVDLDVSGASRMTASSTAATALTITGRVGVNTATPTVDLDVTGNAKLTGNLNMSSSGRITNLVDPVDLQDAATRSYVENQLRDGTLTNVPTVFNSTTTTTAQRIVLSANTTGGPTIRQPISTDADLLYVPSSNTLRVGNAELQGNLNMSSVGRITNLVDPSALQDAATKSYVDRLSARISHYNIRNVSQAPTALQYSPAAIDVPVTNNPRLPLRVTYTMHFVNWPANNNNTNANYNIFLRFVSPFNGTHYSQAYNKVNQLFGGSYNKDTGFYLFNLDYIPVANGLNFTRRVVHGEITFWPRLQMSYNSATVSNSTTIRMTHQCTQFGGTSQTDSWRGCGHLDTSINDQYMDDSTSSLIFEFHTTQNQGAATETYTINPAITVEYYIERY
jgi:hypothetical protein